MALKHGENESLRDFLGRVNGEAVAIPNLQQKMTVLALMSGLKYGNFRSYPGRKSFKTKASSAGKGQRVHKKRKV